jgi:hypothetical protein
MGKPEKPTPTEGPWHVTNSGRSQGGYKHQIGTHEITVAYSWRPLDYDTPRNMANARLIVASCNAFQSDADRLRVNPVELAEALQDGGIAELVRELTAWSDFGDNDVSGILARIPKPETET